jgi:2-polyprenyl-3-methyl-5-hydroxy-6-metoxy-1,4-benzoquinol methylase
MNDNEKENLERFRALASKWDESPLRVALAEAIFVGFKKYVPLHGEMRALEIGAGTGLLTVPLAAEVAGIEAFDLSKEMLGVLAEKIEAEQLDNIGIHEARFPDGAIEGRVFDLIYSAMTLHHVADVPGLLGQAAPFLRPGGFLAIADLVKEDGSFHEDNQGVAHLGFEQRDLAEKVEAVGLRIADIEPVHVIEKEIAPGDVRAYPVFLLVAEKQRSVS